jgi:hypothetical protein
MSSSPNHIAMFCRDGFVVLPHFVDQQDRATLRQAADTTLAWSRAECSETSHTTPRISLLTQATSFEHGGAALASVLAFASSARVCALLDAVARVEAVEAPQLKDAHYYHEQRVGTARRSSESGKAVTGLPTKCRTPFASSSKRATHASFMPGRSIAPRTGARPFAARSTCCTPPPTRQNAVEPRAMLAKPRPGRFDPSSHRGTSPHVVSRTATRIRTKDRIDRHFKLRFDTASHDVARRAREDSNFRHPVP